MLSTSAIKGVVVMPLKTTIGIQYKSKNRGRMMDANIVAGPTKNHYFAFFGEDDVDFKFCFDNKNKDRNFGFDTDILNETHSFSMQSNSTNTLAALVTKGRHLHFVREGGNTGSSLIALAAQEHRLSHAEAAEMMSRIQFNVHYSHQKAISITVSSNYQERHFETVLTVLPSDNIVNVKEKIKLSVPPYPEPEHQRLYFGRKKLQGRETIDSLSIQEGSTLLLSCDNCEFEGYFNVILKTLTNEEHILYCKASQTIEEIKVVIMCMIGIPPDQQRLIHSRRQLEDGRTVSDYNIQSGDFMHLVLRLRGGGGGYAPVPLPQMLLSDEKSTGERGIVCFGAKTQQKFESSTYERDRSIRIAPFVIELRLEPKFSLSPA